MNPVEVVECADRHCDDVTVRRYCAIDDHQFRIAGSDPGPVLPASVAEVRRPFHVAAVIHPIVVRGQGHFLRPESFIPEDQLRLKMR